MTALTVAFVLGLFVWAARKDAEYDRSVQKRLGIAPPYEARDTASRRRPDAG